MKRPWMPLYIGDYLGDTGHLTTLEHGAYLLLIMHYWRKGGLPEDEGQLAKIAKLSSDEWAQHRDVLADFFQGGWFHKRVEAELAKMQRLSHARALAGQRGGLKSAMSRMKLENQAAGRSRPEGQAIAKQSLSKATAKVDHSHSHIEIERSSEPVDKVKGSSNGNLEKAPHQVTRSELEASFAKWRGNA